MIIRGTTPQHTFILPEFEEEITTITVTYSQGDKVKITKEFTSEDIIYTEEGEPQINVDLSQLDTLKFKYYGIPSKDMIEIQIRILDENDEAYASNIMTERVGKVLQDKVI